MRRLDEAEPLAQTMAKFKTELNLTRTPDEMRAPEVTLDFTPNALASVLYKQGDTVVWPVAPKNPLSLGGSQGTPPKGGCMLNIPSFRVQRTLDFVVSATVRRVARRK